MINVNKIISSFIFDNNLLISTTKVNSNDSNENVFSFFQIFPTDQNIFNSNIVTNNLIQGSEGVGFLFPTIECNQISSYFYANNTAGSC